MMAQSRDCRDFGNKIIKYTEGHGRWGGKDGEAKREMEKKEEKEVGEEDVGEIEEKEDEEDEEVEEEAEEKEEERRTIHIVWKIKQLIRLSGLLLVIVPH